MKKLKVNYTWFYLQYVVLAFICVVMLIAPPFLFESNPDQVIYEILWYSMFSILFILLVIFFLLDYQTAELTEKGITIKSFLGLIKSIDWDSVYDIRIESVISGSAGVKLFKKDWIIIYTAPNQFDAYFKPNRRKKNGPWYIAATKENIKFLKEYMFNYLPNILPIEP
ncbi:MAG: hypothetical protein J1F65_00025 [Clostridiales bacterium]|nr:hypothetical protein [Clostridiales bacterium]